MKSSLEAQGTDYYPLHERRLRDHTLLLSATLLFCVASFFLFDRALTLSFQPLNHGLWRAFWKAVTLAGQSEWYLIGGLVVYAWFRKRNREKAKSGLFLFSTVAVSGILADIFKFILGRARPKLFLQQGIFGFEPFQGHIEHAWTSFPSGHSATALSVALTLSLLFPRLRPVFIVTAMLVAASRVVLCQHYLSDVAAGSVLGVMTVTLLYQHYFRFACDKTSTHLPERFQTLFPKGFR
ncbi:MAG: phosphatase PAP2 family protein [Chlorobiaceae bacterium]|nr:phosphatase PAP2 family protein [Chlorobiaceae bacterium]